jgi:hypothetical protein
MGCISGKWKFGNVKMIKSRWRLPFNQYRYRGRPERNELISFLSFVDKKNPPHHASNCQPSFRTDNLPHYSHLGGGLHSLNLIIFRLRITCHILLECWSYVYHQNHTSHGYCSVMRTRVWIVHLPIFKRAEGINVTHWTQLGHVHSASCFCSVWLYCHHFLMHWRCWKHQTSLFLAPRVLECWDNQTVKLTMPRMVLDYG